jgi:hypothetical protein
VQSISCPLYYTWTTETQESIGLSVLSFPAVEEWNEIEHIRCSDMYKVLSAGNASE